jgi:alkyldihydroxyacetonephosphate synthase
MSQSSGESAWGRWGDPSLARALSPELRSLLREALGVRRDGRPVPEIGSLRLPAPRLPAASLGPLRAALGSAHVQLETRARLLHTGGKSTPDLLRLRAGRLDGAPDAVLLPGDHEQVLEILRICSEFRIAVVPFGGGTSVVGGLRPDADGFAAVVAMDLRRLDSLISLDRISRVATLGPGLRGPDAEALLTGHGFTLGHFPQSFEYATIGGFAAARSSGQASAGYGRFDERVVGVRLATPRGTIELGRAPKTAAGPDLRQLVLGSEGTLGAITEISVEVAPVPRQRHYEGWRLPDFQRGADVLRRLVQDGPRPTVVRLSDEVETALGLARPEALGSGGRDGGCLAILGFEGAPDEVERDRALVGEVVREAGGRIEPEAGSSWVEGRFSAPYLRDAMLDAGAIVETLETAGFWSCLPALYTTVRDSLSASLCEQGTPPVVMAHISHVYRSGASLYFTVACAQLEDPIAQWLDAKTAAGDAIIAAGGSITHHHGVGTDHRPWLERELGPLGVAALQAIKRELDPAGVCNPGVLIP